MNAVRLSVDIGGTFTDVALQDDRSSTSRLTTTKVLTTYDDPANAVITGVNEVLQQAGVQAADVDLVLHGTTLATNALIERRGAKTALLTTKGHRDVLEMAFENRFEQYDVNIDRPQPLVPRHWRVGVEERIAADGGVLIDLHEGHLRHQVQQLVDEGVEAVGVCFLHSYAHGTHERRTGELLTEWFPELSVTLSADVCPEIREYERVSTTVANAYVQPLMSRYLHSLSRQLVDLGVVSPVMLMTSGGGLTTLATAARYPIRLVESGPAGGAILAAALAREHNLDQVLSFDMGGTTAKICLIDGGEPLYSRAFEVDRSYRFKKGSGLPVRIPVIEMVEIGAGGGSIAHIDSLRRIMVGPESAGSEPGPACYGRGGTHATVTDADAVLGKLVPDLFAGGKLHLDIAAATEAVRRDVGNGLDQAETEAAYAVSQIVEENMASAARAHAAEWGLGMEGRCMIAFGGAAPLHAASVAQKLRIQRVIVPHGAGVGSALGFLMAPIRFEVVRSHFTHLQGLARLEISVLLEQMREEAGSVLDTAGVTQERHEVCQAYMRYAGQGYEIAVNVSAATISAARDDSDLANTLRSSFEEAYRILYGRTIPGMEVEILSWTLALASPLPATSSLGDALLVADNAHASHRPQRSVSYFDGEVRTDIPVWLRDDLIAGVEITGPALIVEPQTSVMVPDGLSARCAADAAIILTQKA